LTLSGHTGSIIKWESSVSPFLSWTDIAHTTASYTSGALSATTQFRAVVQSGSCAAANSVATIVTINNLVPAAPIIGKITHPDCVVTAGSVVLSGLPAGTWTLYQDGNVIVTGGTGSTYTVTAISPVLPHYFTVKSGTCNSVPSEVVIINPAPSVITTTWEKSVLGIPGWSNGVPSLNDIVVFADNYSSDASIIGCSCLVSEGKNVTIKTGGSMKIVNGVSVLGIGPGAGTLTFENNASLVQINDDAVNSGNISYKRTTGNILNTDYVYWSSPVFGAKATLSAIQTGALLSAIQTGTLYYSFNASRNSWEKANSSTLMLNGKGYIVRGAGTGLASGSLLPRPATFIGKPNNGKLTITVFGLNANNLIGNPYPSAIDADAFLAANKDALEGTLYFWTHASTIKSRTLITDGTAGTGAYAYTSNDYSTYNYTGGTTGVTGIIAAGQGFFAVGKNGGTAIFNNSMRLGAGGAILDNSHFLKPASGSKTAKTATASTVEKNRIWLNLSNSQGAFKQMLVGYITGATNGYDRGYDAVSFNGNSFVNFYSINNNSLLTIQGRALPMQETDAVPLGYSSNIIGGFSISIDKMDGLLTAMDIYLEDKLTNVTHNLNAGSYTFATEKGTFNDRFVLTYATKRVESTITLGTGDYKEASGAVLISNKNKEIKISTPSNEIDKVFVYDLSGRQIYTKSKVNKNELSINTIMSSNQVLIVKVVLQDQSTVIKKIVY
jgi:hypothetical protein